MSDQDDRPSDEDERLERLLAAALQPGPDRVPPPERIAALRAHVEAQARARRGAAAPAPRAPRARHAAPAPTATAAGSDPDGPAATPTPTPEPGPAPEPVPTADLTDEVARRRDRGDGHSRRDLLVGGVAATVGAALGVGATLAADSDPGGGTSAKAPAGPPTEPVTFAPSPGVTTDAALINHTWGTELLLDVKGLPGGRIYQVYFDDTGGAPSIAGSFLSVADTLMKCRFNAAVLRASTKAISIIDPDGNQVLHADLA